MAKCTEGGNQHVGPEVRVSTYEIEVGDEIVMYARVECQACGAGLRNDIVSRRKLD